MESGIDPGHDYYTQDYYNYDHGYDLPQYGSRRKLISPSGLYDEYGEVVVDDDGSYYYSPQESDGEGSRKRRVKLVFDREYETSSTGEESAPETQRGRLSSTHNSQVNVNGSIYVAQNGSIIRTRRSVNTTGPTQTTTTNNNLKLPSPIFSSRLAKHFKKLDKMAATLEERVPLNSFRTTPDGGCNTLRTFQSSGTVATTTTTSSFSNPDSKTLNVFNTRQSSVSSGSTSTSNAGPESVASKSNLLKAAQEGTEQSQSTAERNESEEGERESKVDGSNDETDGLVIREPLECPSDRTQSDEEELWMGPWNSLHIPMTKL
ncbi:uncharacterized protein LOC120737966 isoform X2 [Simochromis diagramma]|uniref:uncharacterized protein LOC120737966 isoform X2 n=1 Tax=Simochromis diagramma TaxID=43689 RepID=UPI001A7E7D06|nr:uncharacterized protein LOC120737966 isoform X2 [Simochromis diagramma]